MCVHQRLDKFGGWHWQQTLSCCQLLGTHCESQFYLGYVMVLTRASEADRTIAVRQYQSRQMRECRLYVMVLLLAQCV